MRNTRNRRGRYDYIARKTAICGALGVNDADSAIIALYDKEKLSAVEISEMLAQSKISITPRSIQRLIKKHGAMRTMGDAFRLAVKKGRVKWAYKDPRLKKKRKYLPSKLRMEILTRDGYKCVLCGATAQMTVLEVDHINGNPTENRADNLQTLCHECNIGKMHYKKER